jgi:hypothetical protein
VARHMDQCSLHIFIVCPILEDLVSTTIDHSCTLSRKFLLDPHFEEDVEHPNPNEDP